MSERHLSRDFLQRQQLRYGLPPETTRALVLGFMTSRPFAELATATGVPHDVINGVFKLPWDRAWVEGEEPPTHQRRVNRSRPADAVEINQALVATIAGLMAEKIAKETARQYLSLSGSLFTAHWRAAVALRKKQRSKRMLSGIHH